MSSTSQLRVPAAGSELAVIKEPEKPPILRVDTPPDTSRWVEDHRDTLLGAVLEHGSLIVRGLGLNDVSDVESTFKQLGQLMVEREAFAPRRRYSDVVYSSSKWPVNQPMCMHNELSYALESPSLMLFACLVAPDDGGATTVADTNTVLQLLPNPLIERIEQIGWLLVRNYNEEIGASLDGAFGTDDRGTIERYCRANAIKFEWQADGGLRTWQRRSAIVRHPRTNAPCWFNQIAFLSEWTMEPELREYLVDCYGEDGLPFNTRLGNGEPIDADTVALITEVYTASTVRESWQAGDLMLVDNIRAAHGREPFKGKREVLVAMANPVNVSDCSRTVSMNT